jgi:multiple sugar transport system permease protein
MGAATRATTLAKHLALIAGAVVMLAPLGWMVLASFKTLPEILAFPPTWLPEQVNLDNYRAVFETADFAKYFLNSVIIAVISVGSVLLTSSLAGYAFAKFTFPGHNVLFIGVLATLMIPFQVRVIPLYVLASELHLLNTYAGLVMPTLVDAFGVFLMRQYMLSIPSELIESARVDSAGEIRIFFSIVLPLCKPALSALTIFTLVVSWESFLWPLLVASTPDMYTLPLGLAQFAGRFVDRTDLQMAAATMTVLPLLVAFLFMQKRFIEGMATTGMK